MRNLEDIKLVKFHLQGAVSLDIERIVEDPVFIQVTGNTLEDKLNNYIKHYLTNETLLSNVPSSNGPADIHVIETEVVTKNAS